MLPYSQPDECQYQPRMDVANIGHISVVLVVPVSWSTQDLRVLILTEPRPP